MFRKILASVLCLMLALAMPLTSLAATDVTVRIVPGAEMASLHESIGPALNSLFLHVIAEDESAVIALESDKGEVLSAAVRGDETGFYASSPLLGERTLYFTMEDIAAFMAEMMKQSGASEAEIAEFQQAMAQMAAPNMATAQASEIDEEAMMNDPAMQQFMEAIEKKMVVTEGTFTDAAHNPATTKTEVVIDSSDMLLMLDSQMVKDIYAQMAESANMDADQLLKTVKDLFSQLDMSYDIVSYTAGDELCAMTMDMVMKGEVTLEVTDANGKTSSEKANFDMLMDMDMNVLTQGELDIVAIVANMTNNGSGSDELKNAVMNLNIAVNDEADSVAIIGDVTGNSKQVNFQGVFAEGENDAVKGWLAVLGGGDQITFMIDAAKENDVQNVLVSLLLRQEATSIVEPTWSDAPMVSVAVQVKEVETPASLNALNAATPETAVQLLKMDETQLNNEINAISTDAMSALFAGIANLPAELLNLFMGTMQ